jgi:hypothetical protein
VQKKLGHERNHDSLEALFTEIIASRTEKPRGDISLESIGYHEHKTFSATSVEKSIVENEGF